MPPLSLAPVRRRALVLWATVSTFPFLGGPGAAQEVEPPPEAAAPGQDAPVPPPPPAFDVIRLANGSVILGEIVGLEANTLTVKTAFGVGETVKVKWTEVAEIETGAEHAFGLADGSLVRGRIVRTEDGQAVIVGESIAGEAEFPLAAVTAIDPPVKKEIQLVGTLNFGATITDGNTQTKAASFTGDAVAQSERQRLTLRAAWNYAEDEDGLTVRNTKGTAKYDFFVTRRFFLYASALFEEDEFQDLKLRSALSGGPGYQFIRRGEFEEWWSAGIDLYAEAGLGYFNEDYEEGEDDAYLTARWAVKLDWPLNDRVTFFHHHEGYPSLEDLSDLYITTEQGVRFSVFGNFIGTLQVNWKWDNTPSPGFERSDVLYLATLGYRFRL